MPKAIAFRPTIENEEFLKTFRKQHNLKDNTKTVNKALEDFRKLLALQSQLEQIPSTPSETTPSPKREGVIIPCPIRPHTIRLLNRNVTIKTPIDRSVCDTCTKQLCETREDIASMKRLGFPTPTPTH